MDRSLLAIRPLGALCLVFAACAAAKLAAAPPVAAPLTRVPPVYAPNADVPVPPGFNEPVTPPALPGQPVSPGAYLPPTVPETHVPVWQRPVLYDAGYAPNDEWCRATRVYRSIFLGRLWVEGELLGWAAKGVDVPPLVTSSPLGTPQADAGVLGLGTTSTLFGGEELHDEMRAGGRLTAGYWWTPAQLDGIQASYLYLDGADIEHRSSGSGNAIIARPFFDIAAVQPSRLLTAYPTVVDGSIFVKSDMDLQAAELMLRRVLATSNNYRLDVFAGYRYGRLYDLLETHEQLTSLDASSGYAAGMEVDRRDLFRSINEFHGGQIGAQARWYRGFWSLQLLGKVAFGGNRSELLIDGETVTVDTTTNPQVVTGFDGGVLAQPSNMGLFNESAFAVMSELGVSLSCELTCQWRASVGYTLLHWTDVARAPELIDAVVNPTQMNGGALSGSSRPRMDFERDSFWAQGINLGAEYQF